LLGWIPSASALDQTPDRAIRHAEASPDFAQAPSGREQSPGLVGLRLRKAGLLLLWQQFGRSAPEQPQDHPVGDAEGIGDLLRPLAQAKQVERFCALGRCEDVLAEGWPRLECVHRLTCCVGLVILLSELESVVARLLLGLDRQRQYREHVRPRQ
jgi:hypothetical protein